MPRDWTVDRTHRPNHDERLREKIRKGMVVSRLIDFANGKIAMESHQVTAALGLLKKILPDLSAVQLSGEGTLNINVSIEDRRKQALEALDAAFTAVVEQPKLVEYLEQDEAAE